MKIGELWVALGIKSDTKTFAKARDELGRFTKNADSSFTKLGKRLGKLGQKNLGSASNIAGAFGLGGMVGKLAPAAIGAGLVVAARDALKFDDALTRLDISSKGAMGSMDSVRARVLEVSRATGVSKEDLVAGSAAFVALTGDGKMASESMATFAKVMNATGAPMEDIVGAAASLNEQLGIGSKDFERAFSILIAGGKAGKIELKDMAALTASLAAGYKEFGASKGIGGVATLGSAFQIVAKNFGSASEAATGLESLMGSILQNSKELRKEHGINIYEADGKTLRSLEAITADINAKNLNATETLALLKRKEAVKTYAALRDNRNQWEEIRQSTLKANDVAEDGAKYQNSATGRLKAAWNDIKVAITEAFTPEVIDAFVMAIKDAISLAKDLAIGVGLIAEHIEEITGGKESRVNKMEGDDALQKALAKGYTLDQIIAVGEARGVDAIGPSRDLAKAGGVSADDMDSPYGINLPTHMASAARRRKAAEAKIAKADAERRQRQFAESPTQMELDQAASTFNMETPELSEAMAESARRAGGVSLHAPVNLTINAPSGDGDDIASSVRRVLDNFWDTKVVELDALGED